MKQEDKMKLSVCKKCGRTSRVVDMSKCPFCAAPPDAPEKLSYTLEGLEGHDPAPRTGEVVLAEDGTPMADFQKLRTDAIGRMFDRDKGCGTIHTTSKFYVELDACVESLLASSTTEAERRGEEKNVQREVFSFLGAHRMSTKEIEEQAVQTERERLSRAIEHEGINLPVGKMNSAAIEAVSFFIRTGKQRFEIK